MEDEINHKMENIRKVMELYEEDPGTDQEEWKKYLNELNDLKVKIHSYGILSDNEDFHEMKAEDIKFLLIPFYQAALMNKFMENRESVLSYCLHFYQEFYKLLSKYEYLTKDRKDLYNKLTKKKDDDEEDEKKPSMEDMSKERENKIGNYRYKKALSDKLKVSNRNVNFKENREGKRLRKQ